VFVALEYFSSEAHSEAHQGSIPTTTHTLCKQYKDAKTMEETETHYFAIQSWWLSSGAATEDALHHLDHWLAFWHFRYKQWGGFMQMVSPYEI